ncbi:MAG: two-component system, OmpR family, phosphate regulon sensor histidine kinase PhoR [Acidobacteriota bacterium]|jgi:signal transduction histidine kinase|nr:two-component system, OmpR family, phosphate regulon sensor histidine kinase PhoR [Acidobacteriota bacterium]
MIERLLVKLKAMPENGRRKEHASILLPFFIIAIGLGVLAYRSYHLSVRMENSVDKLAKQYSAYAADITARHVDAAVRAEFIRASESWQQVERRVAVPGFSALEGWTNANDWIVSAIYIPDYDPSSSVFVSEKTESTGGRARLTREFYTSSGTVRYTYDPDRLLSRVRSTVHQQPLALEGDLRAAVSLVNNVRTPGLVRAKDGFAFVAQLATPLESYGVRAFVPVSYGGGWESHRVISVSLSFVALALTTLGGYLALRGMRKEAETMKLRGALIANVSHELRTPLSMIRLGAETLKRSNKLTEKQRTEIEESILREVLHLSHMVENVLDVARIQHRNAKALAFTPVLPRELVATLISTYESWIKNKGFIVTLNIEETIEEQLWDREAVSRALLNLVDNAIKYSADDKAITVTLRQNAEHVILEVRDRGIGIAASDLSKIFDPYYRAQFSDTQTRRGAGLGLTLVQQIVSSHGGRIEVESEPGSGSTFRLLFPRHTSAESRHVPGLVHAPEPF